MPPTIPSSPSVSADPSLARAAECVIRAEHALAWAGDDGQSDSRARHDLRACLGTLVTALAVLASTPAEAELTADALEIMRRHVLRIDDLLQQPQWNSVWARH